LQHSPRLSQPYCVLHTAPGSARGGHFSKGLAGYNIGSVQKFSAFYFPTELSLVVCNIFVIYVWY
jgi:hypothetical protein